MKKSLTLLICLLTAVTANADRLTMLTNIVNGVTERCDNIDLDPNTTLVDQCHDGEFLVLYHQRNSQVMYYSSFEQGFRWKKDNRNGIFIPTRMGVLSSRNTDVGISDNMSFFMELDNLFGNHVWTRNIMTFFVDDSANVVMGYRVRWNAHRGRFNFHKDNRLYAYRLTDGTPLWNDSVSHNERWGLEDVMYIPSTGRYLLWSDDLKLIDPQKGTEKTITLKTASEYTEKKNKKGDMEDRFMSAPYVAENHVTGIKSNVIFQDGKIYLADSEDLYCFDNDLNILWFAQLPTQATSEMSLRIDGDSLTLLSKGLAYYNGVRQEYGAPFIAKYDANTGRMIFINELDIKGEIKDAYLGKAKSFFLTSKGLSVVANTDDHAVKTYSKDEVGNAERIALSAKYCLDDDRFTTLETKDDNILLVGNDSIYRLFNGNEGRVLKSLASNTLYDFRYGVYTRLAIDSNGRVSKKVPGDLILTDQSGKPRVHFRTPFTHAFYSNTVHILTILTPTSIITTRL